MILRLTFGWAIGWKVYLRGIILSLIVAVIFFPSCKKNDVISVQDIPVLSQQPADVAVKWADMTLYTIRYSAFNTPTYSSRSLGYLGLALYESIVSGDSTHRSLSGQLNGLSLPMAETGKSYHWILSLNAAQDNLLRLLYPVPGNSHHVIHERIDSLYQSVFKEQSKGISLETIERSVQFGKAVAVAIYNWSSSDGGNNAFTRNFDQNYIFPSGSSYWIPPSRGQTISLFPLHPYWGNNRTFLLANSTISVPPILSFSTDPASDYYKMYKEVYDKDRILTLEEREIAAWWGDDPIETFSPPGHSYYLATIAIKNSKSKVVKAAEAYARTGLAVADAFIYCWKAKSTYFNERPSSFVKKYIDPAWIQFWPEPPFPAFPSGHATQSAAAATVLTDLFGGSFSFTDDSHKGFRWYDDLRFLDLRYPSRSFNSFW